MGPGGGFLCDAMLGKFMRMCRHDTADTIDEDVHDGEAIPSRVIDEGCVLLTRDRDLVARTPGALLVDGRSIDAQWDELAAAGIDLTVADPPTRCGRCNGVLASEPEDRQRPEYAPLDPDTECYRCTACGQ